MNWNIGDNRNFFVKLKTKLGLYHIELRKPKFSPKKYANSDRNSTIARYSKVDSKDEISCIKSTIYNGRRKLCVNFQIDTDKVNIVVYPPPPPDQLPLSLLNIYVSV